MVMHFKPKLVKCSEKLAKFQICSTLKGRMTVFSYSKEMVVKKFIKS